MKHEKKSITEKKLKSKCKICNDVLIFGKNIFINGKKDDFFLCLACAKIIVDESFNYNIIQNQNMAR